MYIQERFDGKKEVKTVVQGVLFVSLYLYVIF